MAATAVSILPWPLMMTTGRSGCAFLMRSSRSSPSSFEPCNQMSRITRDGRRSSIAASVSSLSFAVRVRCPSSSRLPEINPRMSASSSTTRISDAMNHSLLLPLALRDRGVRRGFVRIAFVACLLRVPDRQVDAYGCAPHLAVPLRRVGEVQSAAMLLSDALHDGEPKAGAFGARGHIGLDQPLPVFGRQAAAIVDDGNLDSVTLDADLGSDLALVLAILIGFERRVDRRARVFDEVGDGLRKQALIRQRHHGLFGKIELEIDLGPAHLEQEHGLAHDLTHIVQLHDRLRHAREGRELVHHAADIGDLADDGVGALIEDLAILGDGVAIFAADALGRELDRGKRILDLMGDAPRDIGPGARALGADEFGDVVEGDDIALGFRLGAFAGDADGKIAVSAQAMQRNLIGDEATALLLRALQQRAELWDR